MQYRYLIKKMVEFLYQDFKLKMIGQKVKKILKRLSVLICGFFIMACAISIFASSKENISTPTRDVLLMKQDVDYQSILEKFEGGMFKQEGNLVTYEGTQKLNLSEYQLIDNLSESDIERLIDMSILYKFSYDYENDIISLSASA